MSVTFVSVTERNVCMRAKSVGYPRPHALLLRLTLACVFALLLVQSSGRELKVEIELCGS